jgi:hypothetical protein
MITKPNIIQFLNDPKLLGLSLSPAQETLLRSIYGLLLPSKEHLDLFRQCTGRSSYLGQPFFESTVLAGARAGKDSRIACPIVTYEAVFGGHEKYLSRGEMGFIPLVAQDSRATRIAFSYIRDYLTNSKPLAGMVDKVLSQEIRLSNRINISCFPSSQGALRGWSNPGGCVDEVGFFRLEGQADSDVEILASIRRGMLAFPNPRLIKISTPYMKSGVLYEGFKNYWGKDSPDVLLWKASTTLMNPTIKADRLDRERRLDPSRFAREYEAEFSEDVDSFLPGAWVEQAVVSGRHELAAQPGMKYVAACDTSSGGADGFTMSVVHSEGQDTGQKIVQDLMKGWSRSKSGTVDLERTVKQVAEILKRYKLDEITGDRYAAGWVRERFQAEGLRYQDAKKDKSQVYLEAEPLSAQGPIEILDHPQLVRELKILEAGRAPGERRLSIIQAGSMTTTATPFVWLLTKR